MKQFLSFSIQYWFWRVVLEEKRREKRMIYRIGIRGNFCVAISHESERAVSHETNRQNNG